MIDIPSRYELKYLIPEWQIGAVRRAIEPFCVLDASSAAQPGHSYGIQSLYLDTLDRDLYRLSCERRLRRFKVRVRRYDGSDVVFLEVKNKEHHLVRKTRAKIPFRGWGERVRGPVHENASPGERAFCERLERCQLIPTLMVRYLREAWVSTVDSYARVTFDRLVICQPCDRWSFGVDERSWVALDSARSMSGVPTAVVLELKCLTAVPTWLSNVARTVGLQRTRYSKYCKGVERLYARDTLLDLLTQV